MDARTAANVAFWTAAEAAAAGFLSLGAYSFLVVFSLPFCIYALTKDRPSWRVWAAVVLNTLALAWLGELVNALLD